MHDDLKVRRSSDAPPSFRENLERFFEVVTMRKFPKLSYIIVTCSLFEHLTEAGLMGLMAIYFQTLFNLDASHVTVALHLYNCLKYFAVILGAVLADSYFGRVKLVIVGQIIFFLGNTLLAVSSIWRMAFPSRFVLILALFAKVIGPGFIQPCLVPLAADQMKQQRTTYTEMKAFFVFYFAMLQVTEFIAKLFLPIVLEVSCFKMESCYPLAFGIPAVLSLIPLMVFCMIKNRCFNITPHQPIIIQGLQCCWHALRMTIKNRKTDKREHWLYRADDRYDMKFIEDIRRTISVLFIPIPFYWSLNDQQFTTWTMQAARLNTEISSGFQIMPEQTQAFGPFFFLLFIPVFHFFIYDLLYPFKFLRTLLRRMVTGGFMIGMSFLMAYYLELRIEFSYADLPASGTAYLYVFNGINLGVRCEIENQNIYIMPHEFSKLTVHLSEDNPKFKATIRYDNKNILAEFVAKEETAVSYAVVGPEPIEFLRIGNEYDVNRHTKGLVKLRITCFEKNYCKDMNLRFYPKTWYIQRPIIAKIHDVQEPVEMKLLSGVYEVYGDLDQSQVTEKVDLGTGGVYNMMVYRMGNKTVVKHFELTPPNEISVLWMLPQYVVLSVSMVLFRISAFAFIYTETPDQMKSLAWSMCYMTLSVGNIVTAIFGGTAKPSTSFLMFGLGMFLGMFLFMQAAALFKYTHQYPERLTKKSLLNVF